VTDAMNQSAIQKKCSEISRNWMSQIWISYCWAEHIFAQYKKFRSRTKTSSVFSDWFI